MEQSLAVAAAAALWACAGRPQAPPTPTLEPCRPAPSFSDSVGPDGLPDSVPHPHAVNGREVISFMANEYRRLGLADQGISGHPVVRVTLDEGGLPVRAEIAESAGNDRLDALALSAVLRMRFSMAGREGCLPPDPFTLPLTFESRGRR